MELTDNIIEICGKIHDKWIKASDHFYFVDSISNEKRRNIIDYMQINNNENIIAFYDDTVFCNCKKGYAICTSGIYLNCVSFASNPKYFSWKEFSQMELVLQLGSCISMNGYVINIMWGKMTLELFKRIQDTITSEENVKDNKQYYYEDKVNTECMDFLYDVVSICKETCEEWKNRDFYFTDSISNEDRRSIIEALQIDEHDDIIVFYNDASFSNFKRGYAICKNGVYLNDSGFASNPRYFSWTEFSQIEPVLKHGKSIDMDGYPIGKSAGKMTLELFKRIQSIINIKENNCNGEHITEFLNDVIEICKKTKEDWNNIYFHVLDLISEKKLDNIINYYEINNSKDIIAFYDSTLFGSYKKGLIICKNGIYLNNYGSNPMPKYFSWKQFSQIEIKLIDGDNIDLDGYVLWVNVAKEMVEFLQKIQQVIIAYENDKDGCEKVNGDEKKANTEWMIALDGKQCGPFSEEIIYRKIMKSEINPELCYVWKVGMDNWVLMTEVQELQETIKEARRKLQPPPLPPKIFVSDNKDNDLLDENTAYDKKSDAKVDINNCSLNELLTLECMDLKNAKLILEKRSNGKTFYSAEEIESFLSLKPHEVEEIRDKVIFVADKNKKWNSRIIDY